MIDLDRMEQQLESALTEPTRPQAGTASPRPADPSPGRDRRRPRAVPAPARPAPEPGPPPRRDVRGLLELGLIGEVDARIAAATDPRDGVAWTTMRALLDGREDAARAGVEALAAHARATDDAAVWERYWIQRFWVAVEWGTVPERYDLLDHCRERAYRFDELGWWGDLTLLLATVGNTDEAARAFDAALALLGSQAKDDAWLDAATNLVEAAALLGDASRAGLVHGRVVWPEGRMVVVGPAIVCKGSIDRYRALGLAALGRWAEADECFRAAAAAHREIGAGPLLARTLRQADRARAAA